MEDTAEYLYLSISVFPLETSIFLERFSLKEKDRGLQKNADRGLQHWAQPWAQQLGTANLQHAQSTPELACTRSWRVPEQSRVVRWPTDLP